MSVKGYFDRQNYIELHNGSQYYCKKGQFVIITSLDEFDTPKRNLKKIIDKEIVKKKLTLDIGKTEKK